LAVFGLKIAVLDVLLYQLFHFVAHIFLGFSIEMQPYHKGCIS
jgi:hypothetical protein